MFKTTKIVSNHYLNTGSIEFIRFWNDESSFMTISETLSTSSSTTVRIHLSQVEFRLKSKLPIIILSQHIRFPIRICLSKFHAGEVNGVELWAKVFCDIGDIVSLSTLFWWHFLNVWNVVDFWFLIPLKTLRHFFTLKILSHRKSYRWLERTQSSPKLVLPHWFSTMTQNLQCEKVSNLYLSKRY